MLKEALFFFLLLFMIASTIIIISSSSIYSRSTRKNKEENKNYNNKNKFVQSVKGLLHCFSTCIEITEDNCYCFIFKNIENCKEKFQWVNKLCGI